MLGIAHCASSLPTIIRHESTKFPALPESWDSENILIRIQGTRQLRQSSWSYHSQARYHQLMRTVVTLARTGMQCGMWVLSAVRSCFKSGWIKWKTRMKPNADSLSLSPRYLSDESARAESVGNLRPHKERMSAICRLYQLKMTPDATQISITVYDQ